MTPVTVAIEQTHQPVRGEVAGAAAAAAVAVVDLVRVGSTVG